MERYAWKHVTRDFTGDAWRKTVLLQFVAFEQLGSTACRDSFDLSIPLCMGKTFKVKAF
jgi:hypothetical protein